MSRREKKMLVTGMILGQALVAVSLIIIGISGRHVVAACPMFITFLIMRWPEKSS